MQRDEQFPIYALGILGHLLRLVIEAKSYVEEVINTPIIIWEYDKIPKDGDVWPWHSHNTVDGRNLAPVDTVGSLSHYLQWILHPRWCRISSINSMYSLNFKLNDTKSK